jgi:F-type H+-transporting ATPase subunit epsilon
MPLPTKLTLEVVTPEGLLLREEVDHVQAPGSEGYGKDGVDRQLTCFWGFCEVLPDRVNILAEIGERAEAIDLSRAEAAKARAEARMKAIRDEAGYKEAHDASVRALTRLAAAGRRRS